MGGGIENLIKLSAMKKAAGLRGRYKKPLRESFLMFWYSFVKAIARVLDRKSVWCYVRVVYYLQIV